jgi:hypothetical protein
MTTIRLRGENLFWRESGGEIVALDANGSRYFAANRSAAPLWKGLAEGTTEADLVTTLCERHGLSREDASADVAAFLEELSARGLLEPPSPA